MEWEFRDDVEASPSDEPWYDLYDGGYIDPYAVLKTEEQASAVSEAIAIVGSFIDEYQEYYEPDGEEC